MPRMRALSMSVLLAENTPHNGPLMLIPGSHQTYLTCVGETPDDHYLSSLKRQERSEEHTSELQSLMRISYAVICLKKKTIQYNTSLEHNTHREQTRTKATPSIRLH